MWVEVMCSFWMEYFIAMWDNVVTMEAQVGMKPPLIRPQEADE